MRRTFLEELPPESCERHETLRLYPHARESDGKVTLLCKAWRGKQRKPFAFYSFRSEDRRAAWMAEQRESETALNVAKLARADDRKRRTAEFRAQLVVGALLHTSWGYDQTNVEFYEVVGFKGVSMVWLREVATDLEQTGFMSGTRTPRTGEFVGEPFVRRIGAGSIRIGTSQTAWLGGEPASCSWYA